jgi:two-component system cell cycle sensor histidine kinase/response regulator CckA
LITTVAAELTDRARAEDALRASEESYRLLFDRHPGPMWLFDVETLRFLAVNDAAVDLYGYSADEFLSMTINDIRPEEDLPKLQEKLDSLGSRPFDAGVWRHRTKDGAPLDVAIHTSTVDFGARRARVVLALDVTSQRLLEEQLRQAQKMEAIGSLAGGIAHDFNNIVTVIRGYARVLMPSLVDDSSKESLALIDRAAEQAGELTGQLLAFSRQQILRAEVTDLNQVVQETLTLLDRMLRESIVIERSLDPALAAVLVDRSQITQVILNLAVNARDAMPDGGTLSVQTTNVELDEAYATAHSDVSPGHYVLLQVTDSGPGMDEQTRSRIFDPFFTTKETGTGLGLATVFGIVKQSDGHIWLYSEPGMGTTFKIYFPATNATVSAAVVVPEVTSLEGTETILVVEDNDLLRPLVADVLASYGYTVLTAGDGRAAVELAADERTPTIDLLLTDVVMPQMNGSEVAETLTAKQPGLRVLFSSGYPSNTVVRHGIAEARTAFIQKPYLGDELVLKIRELFAETA